MVMVPVYGSQLLMVMVPVYGPQLGMGLLIVCPCVLSPVYGPQLGMGLLIVNGYGSIVNGYGSSVWTPVRHGPLDCMPVCVEPSV